MRMDTLRAGRTKLDSYSCMCFVLNTGAFIQLCVYSFIDLSDTYINILDSSLHLLILVG